MTYNLNNEFDLVNEYNTTTKTLIKDKKPDPI